MQGSTTKCDNINDFPFEAETYERRRIDEVADLVAIRKFPNFAASLVSDS